MSYSKQNFRSGDTLYASQLNAMDDEIAVLEAEVESTKNMVGSPLTASTAAGMSDQTKIYVYTGSETGYTAGHWYYYNGTAWTDGGVYNSVAVNTDTFLTVSGQAADSKAVGDAIDDLDSDLSDVKSDLQQTQTSMTSLAETATKAVDSNATGVDLDITDPSGNVIVRLADGHIQTKNFDSEDISDRVTALEEEEPVIPVYLPDVMESDASGVDLDVTDTHGNVVARFSGGQIKTKNFDSETLQEAVADVEEAITEVTKEVNFIKRVRTRMGFGAHNGAEYYAPECTVPAYRIAGQQGWEWAWIAGIAFSADGSMYVIHDDTVDRTTDGTGYINQMTDAQINACNIDITGPGYDLSDFDPSELKIPTFEQVVQQCVKYGMKMVIRLSLFPNGTDTAENKAKWDNFLEVINGYGVQPEDISCYLDTGTKAGTCRTLIGDNVEISTHLGINATASDFVTWFESRSITGKKAAILSYQNTNLEAVKLLHSHGIRVYSYGTNVQAQADNCALWGVDIYQNGRIYKITE